MHLLRMLLPKQFMNFNTVIEILKDPIGHIYFIEKLDAGGCIASQLSRYRIEVVFRQGLDLLIDCPCSIGCPSCLQSLNCRERPWNQNLDELGFMKFLGDYVNNKEVPFIIECRRDGMPATDQANEALHTFRDDVLGLFRDKFDLSLMATAHLNYVRDDELSNQGYAGLFNPGPNTVSINHGLHELRTRAVVAHEYAHIWQINPYLERPNMANWLTDASLLYDGKLLLEGFAKWVSYRYYDFLSFDREMKHIDLKCDDGYGDGFDVIKYIEDRHGFFEVFRFIKDESKYFPDLASFRKLEKDVGLQIFEPYSH